MRLCRTLFFELLIGLTLPLCGGCCFADGALQGTADGQLWDEGSGQPISGATVSVRLLDGDEPQGDLGFGAAVATDSEGHFQVEVSDTLGSALLLCVVPIYSEKPPERIEIRVHLADGSEGRTVLPLPDNTSEDPSHAEFSLGDVRVAIGE